MGCRTVTLGAIQLWSSGEREGLITAGWLLATREPVTINSTSIVLPSGVRALARHQETKRTQVLTYFQPVSSSRQRRFTGSEGDECMKMISTKISLDSVW